MGVQQLRELLALDFIRCRFVLSPLSDIRFYAFSGATIRGALGTVLRDHLCVNKNAECVYCRLKHRCVYSLIFETPPPEDAAMMRLYPQAPHPLVIRPPSVKLHPSHFEHDFTVEIIMMGKSINYFPYMVQAVFELAERGLGAGRGKYKVLLVEEARAHGWSRVYRHGDNKIPGEITSVKLPDLVNIPADDGRIKIKIHTPLRIKYGGKIARTLRGDILARNLLRRASSLLYFHAGLRLAWDFEGLIAQARSIKTMRDSTTWVGYDRFSGRQKRVMHFGGLIGQLVFANVPQALKELYSFGSLVGAGKNTSFGLGWYSIK